MAFCCALASAFSTPALALSGRVLDADSNAPVPGALITAHTSVASHRTRSDSSGAFALDLASGNWQLSVEHLGYATARLRTTTPLATPLAIRLQPRPLVMDEMIVRTRRAPGGADSPAFVERIAVPERRTAGTDLPRLLDRAVGVQIRRYGGLGSFSTVSIRGSTAEQVQIFLDGVPLNQAIGGGVDLGNLPLSGIESIDVYRGAVPARFGGNSIGGVVHIRTRAPGAKPRLQLNAGTGSFGTRQLGLSLNGVYGAYRYTALADYGASRNDFLFFDDNGTEYNALDDEWAKRLNSDFGGLRSLFKIAHAWGQHRLRLHATFDLNHRGIPGISNNQSLHTRFDARQHLVEAELSGTLRSSGYRLGAYRLAQENEYQDLLGEVGTGTQHNRNATRTLGLRGEWHLPLFGSGLLSTFARARRETFAPRNLLSAANHPASRRHALSLGTELEAPLMDGRLVLSGGSQLDALRDRFFGEKDFTPSTLTPARKKSSALGGFRLGFRLDLGRGWSLRGHRGLYRRPPSFFELFGDRGAVLGNTDLVSEKGHNWDVGLDYRGKSDALGLLLLEVAYYQNAVEDLIRFAQNSQSVSTPHNIGKAQLSGLETRLQLRLLSQLRLDCNYTYQRAENRSPFAYERGNDLPNAPRHALDGHLSLGGDKHSVYYALSRESRHFLDRANLRPVPVRLVHSLGGDIAVPASTVLVWEVRNLTDDQVADLWGYPLPGRAYFLSLKRNFSL